FSSDRDQVLLEDINAAIDELQWPEFSARSPGRRAANASQDGSSSGSYDADASSIRKGPDLYVGPADTDSHPLLPEQALAKLVVVTEGRTVGELKLRVGRRVVGRTPDNDLQIDSRFVSRHHCQIVTKVNACIVEDLNSTNGIVVKSKRVRRHNLNDGDVITIGKHDLIYVDERSGQRSGQTGLHPSSDVEADAEPDDSGHDDTHVN
ncbi:MAG: FHA domain-containing protein, partial [Steroidobacteraceae bacterium]